MRACLVGLVLLLASTSASASVLPGTRPRLVGDLTFAHSTPSLLVLGPSAGGGADAALAKSVMTVWSTGLAFVIVGVVFFVVTYLSVDDADDGIKSAFYFAGALFAGTGVLMMLGGWLCWSAQGGGGEAPARVAAIAKGHDSGRSQVSRARGPGLAFSF